MGSYDSTRFSPSAPLAVVILRNSENGLEERDVPMLLDTGSDVTIVPQIYESRLNLTVNRQFELTGFDNKKSLSRTVNLDLIFEGKTFRGEYF